MIHPSTLQALHQSIIVIPLLNKLYVVRILSIAAVQKKKKNATLDVTFTLVEILKSDI